MHSRVPRFVSDIMTRELITIGAQDDLSGVEQAMDRFGFRHLPVVEQGVLVGLVTHRDLMRASVSSLEVAATQRDEGLKRRTRARDIMKRDVATVRADAPLSRAARIMRDKRIGALPVIDADKRLVGIVAKSDYLKLAIRLLDTLLPEDRPSTLPPPPVPPAPRARS